MPLFDSSLPCPYCGERIDSDDSYAATRTMVRRHIQAKHKGWVDDGTDE